ncbi:MAG: DUF6069 family protein [Acidimicrobiia bacterium]
MSTRATTANGATLPARRARGGRLRAVVAAVLAAGAGWTVVEVLGGVDLRAPAFDGSGAGQDVGLVAVVLTSLVASLSAWGLLAVLERYLVRARRIWTVLVLTGFVISLGGPMSGTGIDATDRALLAVLHLIVAAVLIPLLYRTAAQLDERGGRNDR